MPEVDYVVLSEWFDWITRNMNVSIDLIGEMAPPNFPPCPPALGPGRVSLVRCQLAGAVGRTLTWVIPHISSAFSPRVDGIRGL